MFRVLQGDEIGMDLTESLAMMPAASVSGFYLAHPAGTYFNVGKIGDDQLADWARRSARTSISCAARSPRSSSKTASELRSASAPQSARSHEPARQRFVDSVTRGSRCERLPIDAADFSSAQARRSGRIPPVSAAPFAAFWRLFLRLLRPIDGVPAVACGLRSCDL